jgi:outer membrane murein-binding lipoprotein Lpp
MSLTRPTAMTPEEAEKIMKEAIARGASVLVSDPRVTAWTNWLLGAIALGLLSGFWSMFASINQLKEQNATLNANVQFLQQQFAAAQGDECAGQCGTGHACRSTTIVACG